MSRSWARQRCITMRSPPSVDPGAPDPPSIETGKEIEVPIDLSETELTHRRPMTAEVRPFQPREDHGKPSDT